MSQIFKAYMGVLMILLMGFSAGGILGAYLCVAGAQDFHALVISELEGSDYYPKVVENCCARAGEAGYQLEIIYYTENGESGIWDGTGTFPDAVDGNRIEMAKVNLTFPLRIAFFGIQQEHTLCGYAR